MKWGIFVVLLVSLALSGCIQMEQKHDIRADGTDYIEVELYKTGLMVNMDCDSFRNWVRTSSDLSMEEINEINSAPCKETESSIIVSGVRPLSKNPTLQEIDMDGTIIFRYESEASPFIETTVKMPSKVLRHNGELVDSQTVRFAPGAIGGEQINYVEAEKPNSLCCLPIAIIGAVGLVMCLSCGRRG